LYFRNNMHSRDTKWAPSLQCSSVYGDWNRPPGSRSLVEFSEINIIKFARRRWPAPSTFDSGQLLLCFCETNLGSCLRNEKWETVVCKAFFFLRTRLVDPRRNSAAICNSAVLGITAPADHLVWGQKFCTVFLVSNLRIHT